MWWPSGRRVEVWGLELIWSLSLGFEAPQGSYSTEDSEEPALCGIPFGIQGKETLPKPDLRTSSLISFCHSFTVLS